MSNKNDIVRRVAEQRSRLERRIKELGGNIPKFWSWDYDTSARNLQLIEVVEALEKTHGQT